MDSRDARAGFGDRPQARPDGERRGIDSSIAGAAGSDREAATSYTNFNVARWQVEHTNALNSGGHVFLYIAPTDTGYLLSDLHRNYSFETGVVINGAGAASDMIDSDIL